MRFYNILIYKSTVNLYNKAMKKITVERMITHNEKD